MKVNRRHIKQLKQAYLENGITLYLGSGVSIESGIPNWEKLVALMYYATPDLQNTPTNLRPFPNYLFAIAEWHLKRSQEPLDITARKIRSCYRNDGDFLKNLKNTLYAKIKSPDEEQIYADKLDAIVQKNKTLDAVVSLCNKKRIDQKGVQAIITYNYDDLLELALNREKIEYIPIWKEGKNDKSNKLPIYHVHGFIPANSEGSKCEEIIFTEDKYHQISHNTYYWSNLVQIKQMTNSSGLMIGLSLTDKNMRRILDAIRKSPIALENYLLLQEPNWEKPDTQEIDIIHERASEYFDEFLNSGIKPDSRRFSEILQIIKNVEKSDKILHEKILNNLGINVIWYKSHLEISKILNMISN